MNPIEIEAMVYLVIDQTINIIDSPEERANMYRSVGQELLKMASEMDKLREYNAGTE